MLAVQEKRYEAVFISDLHLNPGEPSITARFNVFINWAALNTKSVYILGDFFHVWAGDDSFEPWSKAIAERLLWLSQQKVSIYFMHGNRDFLLGNVFANSAGMTILSEPAVIQLDNQNVLLMHGDRYCTNDKSHQRFRRLTRNPWFAKLFLHIPLKIRSRIVSTVRQRSQTNKSKTDTQMDIVLQPMIEHMDELNVNILIHGHIHKPGLRNHRYNDKSYSQYVLSDWDDSPKILCYYKTKGLEFVRSDLIEE